METKEFFEDELIIIKLHGEPLNWKFITIEDVSDTSKVWFGRIDSIKSIAISNNMLKINILGANEPLSLTVSPIDEELRYKLKTIFNRLKSLMIESSI